MADGAARVEAVNGSAHKEVVDGAERAGVADGAARSIKANGAARMALADGAARAAMAEEIRLGGGGWIQVAEEGVWRGTQHSGTRTHARTHAHAHTRTHKCVGALTLAQMPAHTQVIGECPAL